MPKAQRSVPFFTFAWLIFNCLALVAPNLRAADETELITFLQSSAGVPTSCISCVSA